MTRIISKGDVFEKLREKIPRLLGEKALRMTRLKAMCQLMLSLAPHYNWVGIYLVDRDEPDVLLLGPYAGASTEHERIPFGRGVCGQVAFSEKTRVVPDVTRADEYLSCSPDVRSEVVVPIMKEDRFVGVLDIDSHLDDAFDEGDVVFLEELSRRVAPLIV
jgi:L-methionine (R)-S-oxide reductase